jgi:hypothetical protein
MGQPQIPVLNGATPAPPSGYQNARWQQGASLGNDPTYGVPRIPDSCYVPNAGGASVKTANYTATIADMGTLLSFNSASAMTLTLPNPIPLNALSTPTTETRWNISVQNIGVGALTISPNALDLDGSASSLVLTQDAGVLIYTDGTNYFTERGNGQSLTNYATIAGVQEESYTAAADTGSANAYAVTLSPAPTVGAYSEIVFKAANANTGVSTVTVNGTSYPLTKNGSEPLVLGDISVGQIVTAKYDGTNFQASGISPNVLLIPNIRGSNAQITVSGFTFSVNLPTGTLAGDFALLYALEPSGNATVPTGWTEIDADFPIAWVASKILTSTDITAGSVTISGAISGYALAQIVTFIGPTGGVREVRGTGNGSSTGNFTETVTTSSAVLSTDVGIYFAGAGITSGGSVVVSPGNVLQNPMSAALATGIIADQSMPGGVTSVLFTYTDVNTVSAQHVVIVEGVSSGVPSVTSVGLTMPTEFAVSGSPITSNGTLAVTKNTQTANQVYAGPSSGSATAPTFRALVPADVLGPALLTGTSASLGGSAIASGSTATITVTVTGAVVGSPVSVAASDGTGPNPLIALSAWVSAAGVVTIQLANPSAGSVTPTAKTYKVTVL